MDFNCDVIPMKTQAILDELKALGRESYKRVMVKNHGVPEPLFGVPISELQKIRKRIKGDHGLALSLYATGNYDARYLAGLIADDARMTKAELKTWVEQAVGGGLAGSTVAWVAAGNPHARELAMEWIESSVSHVAQAGWATVAGLVSITPDERLDLVWLEGLMERIRRDINGAPDRVRYQMNACLIAVGCYVKPLTEKVLRIAEGIGPVEADLGNNSCGIPYAPDCIAKARERGTLGKKRKSAKC